ncbi:hypothetical protein ABL78_7384 [Leptomonas seymouri]|uniref:Uncharacterized protein n=1 Tax=Leptomonas seymouri TaxID=5684 RepID=A0A0N1HSG2_LEPSE|nr:hypothetical protein ABL78_7384 [Leptomonas seymouri]|eukprot:KPI83581.1 hypothetical protein ABL78_7384 [Leptomonas seymouri]
MTTSPEELKQLKRALLSKYEGELARLASPEPAATAGPSEDTADQRADRVPSMTFPSASCLNLQLLCLREGKSVKDIPTAAREQVVMLANAMPPPYVLVEDRLRTAQEESVRLLVKRTAAIIAPAGDRPTAEQPVEGSSGQQGDNEKASPAPVASEWRLQLLERMYAANMQALAGAEESEPQAAENA